MAEVENRIHQNNVSYLFNISEMIGDELEACTVLKSYYLTKARITEIKAKSYLPSKLVKKDVRCPHCHLPHNEVESIPCIVPQRKPTRFTRKLLRKQALDAPCTTYQRKTVRNLNADNANKLVFKCKVCKHEVAQKLAKPKKAEHFIAAPAVKKTKKKKKDRFSGLNKDIVLAATQSNIRKPPKHKEITLWLQKPPFHNKIQTKKELEKMQTLVLKEKAKSKRKLNSLSSVLNKAKDAKSNTLKDFLKSIS